MAGPNYNNLNIRDELDLKTTGHIKGAASVSGTAGKITTLTATTLTPTTVNATDITLSGDLTRSTGKYISGASGDVPSGYTRCPDSTLIIDEGIAILSGKSGNIYPKISTTPSVGKILTLIYINSGAADTFTAKVSGNFKISKDGGTIATQHYATFNFPGDALTVTGDGTYWYPIHPASGSNMGGPVFSTT